MDLALFFGGSSGIVHLASFVIYNQQVRRDQSTPNPSMLSLWVYLTILNASSYTVMTGDFVKGILPAAGALACLATFIFVLIKGKFSKLDRLGYIILALGILSGLVWWYFKSATYGNLLLQIPIALSFVPTYRDVWRNPKSEKAFAWYGWGFAYLLLLLVCYIGWKGQLVDLIYPGLAFVMHSSVGLLTHRNIRVA